MWTDLSPWLLLDAVGVKFRLEPEINECLLHSQENCVGDMIFNF